MWWFLLYYVVLVSVVLCGDDCYFGKYIPIAMWCWFHGLMMVVYVLVSSEVYLCCEDIEIFDMRGSNRLV